MKHRLVLPLFRYFVTQLQVGLMINFYVPAIRIETRYTAGMCRLSIIKKVEQEVERLLKAYPTNRLVSHLANNCALTYHCPAARNYFMGRWECPIPSSPACNANCIWCISFQPEERQIISTQDRLRFKTYS
jgi:hypothetical protein